MSRTWSACNYESAKELYTWPEEKFIKLGFLKQNNTYNLFLFPKNAIDFIPEGFIIELDLSNENEINRKFIPFKYNEIEKLNTIKYYNRSEKSEYIRVGINIDYTYDEVLIKSIIE